MWIFEDTVLLFLLIVFAQEGSASVETYIEQAIQKFGKQKAERENGALMWTDFLHQRLPATLQYRKVKVRWTQEDVRYGPEIKVIHKEVRAYTTKVDQRKRKIRSKLSLQRAVTITNVFDVWTLDAKEIISDQLFTAGLKGIIQTKVYSDESYAHEVETTIHITETETLRVRTEVPIAARSITKIAWIIKEDEAEMKWTVATYISGYFAICLKDSNQNEKILVFSVTELSSVDSRLKVIGNTEVMRVSHGTIKSVKATGSYIQVNETLMNSKKQVRRSIAKIQT